MMRSERQRNAPANAAAPAKGTAGSGGTAVVMPPRVAQLQQLAATINGSPHVQRTARLHDQVLQGRFEGSHAFVNMTMDGFAQHFGPLLRGLGWREKQRIYNSLRESPEPFTMDNIEAGIAALRGNGGQPQGLPPPALPREGGGGPPPVRDDRAPPVALLQPLVVAMNEAVEAAQAEVRNMPAPEPDIVRHAGPDAAPQHRQEPARDAAAVHAEAPDELPRGAVIVNFVWFGNNPLGPLEKFNVYSWRALGHRVNIFALRFDGAVPTGHTLGLADGEARVINLRAQLGADADEPDPESPKHQLGDARAVLQAWIAAIPHGHAPTKEHIYNMVDLTKSYLGGSQQGIVLDMKVGPSPHLPHYADRFHDRFISYSRGGKSAAGVENQSMGTMAADNRLRSIYAKRFNSRFTGAVAEFSRQFDGAWFNYITGYHSQAFLKAFHKTETLDVAKQAPDGTPITGRNLQVSEPGGPGDGPFRVFKAASDQSNQISGKTRPDDVRRLAADVWRDEISQAPNGGAFVDQARGAAENLPSQ